MTMKRCFRFRQEDDTVSAGSAMNLRFLIKRERTAEIMSAWNEELFTVGNIVTFGNYKGNDLVWKVLVKDGRRFMLLSQNNVAVHSFHTERVEVDLNSCELRKWLNRDFLNEAFSLQERMRIILHRNENGVDYRWDTANGPDTNDKIYIFNYKELEEYLPEKSDRAIGEWWWLRGHGCSNLNQQAVYEDGTVYEEGISSFSVGVGVRPVIWVQLTADFSSRS